MDERALNGKRVAIYARCSSKDRDASIREQVRVAIEFARNCGGCVPDEHIFLDAANGCTEKRAGLTELLGLVEAGALDFVLCGDQSRLSRNRDHASGIVQRLHHCGVRLLTVHGGDSGPSSAVH